MPSRERGPRRSVVVTSMLPSVGARNISNRGSVRGMVVLESRRMGPGAAKRRGEAWPRRLPPSRPGSDAVVQPLAAPRAGRRARRSCRARRPVAERRQLAALVTSTRAVDRGEQVVVDAISRKSTHSPGASSSCEKRAGYELFLATRRGEGDEGSGNRTPIVHPPRRRAAAARADPRRPRRRESGRPGRAASAWPKMRSRLALLARDRVGQLGLGHARAALDAGLLRALVELLLRVALDVDAAVGALRAGCAPRRRAAWTAGRTGPSRPSPPSGRRPSRTSA